jgi:hypothetical protein
VVKRLSDHCQRDVPAGKRRPSMRLGAPCKTVGSAYPGSNPGPATTQNCWSELVSAASQQPERERSATPPAFATPRGSCRSARRAGAWPWQDCSAPANMRRSFRLSRCRTRRVSHGQKRLRIRAGPRRRARQSGSRLTASGNGEQLNHAPAAAALPVRRPPLWLPALLPSGPVVPLDTRQLASQALLPTVAIWQTPA